MREATKAAHLSGLVHGIAATVTNAVSSPANANTKMTMNQSLQKTHAMAMQHAMAMEQAMDMLKIAPTEQPQSKILTLAGEGEWEKYYEEGTARPWFLHPETCAKFFCDDVQSGWKCHPVWVNAAEGCCFFDPDDDGLCKFFGLQSE